MGLREVFVPDIGDFKDVEVIEMLVKAGDHVKVDQSLVTVESDKASMEIPSSHSGIVKEVHVKLGDKLSQGKPLVVLEETAAAEAKEEAPSSSLASISAPSAVSTPAPNPPARSTGSSAAVESGAPPRDVARAPATPGAISSDAVTTPAGYAHASPTIRKFARELGVALAQVRGSGPKGRITKEDVQLFVKQALQNGLRQQSAQPASGLPGLLPWPQVDFSKFGPIERRDLSRIKKISGANLQRNWVMIPHVTNHEDADITELEAFRVDVNKEQDGKGGKLTMLAFLVKASVAALKKFPDFNASLDGDQLVLKQYYHIGFAADTPNGLVVPVIRDADKKSVMEIAKEMGELAAKAREGKLSPGEMTGGCFSISSLGGIGGTGFTPIINAPEVAILGVSKAAMKPVWDGKSFVPRLILPMSLSWDHRVIDGAAAGRFNAYLARILADFRRISL